MKKPVLTLLLIFGCTLAWGQKKTKTPVPCDSTVIIPVSLILDNYVHDKFLPEFTGRKPVEYHLQIFDQVGLLYFDTEDYQLAWNGRFKYTVVQHGTYHWEITYRYEGESEKRYCQGKVIMNTQKN